MSGRRALVGSLVVALAVVIGVAMAVSYHALEAVALAIGAGGTAPLYPVSVDGVIGIAVVASLVLRGGPGAWWAVGTLIGYTTASGVLNVAHADGLMTHPSPVLVVLAAVLPVGTVALGTHLVVLVLRHGTAPSGVEAEPVPDAAPVPVPVITDAPVRPAGTTPSATPVPTPTDDPVPAPVDDPSRTTPSPGADLAGTTPSDAVSDAPVLTLSDPRPPTRPARVRTATRTTPSRPVRPTRPTRSRSDLLDTVRQLADESGTTPTAAAIQRAVRCRAETARDLRDAVHAERAAAAALVADAETALTDTPAEVTR